MHARLPGRRRDGGRDPQRLQPHPGVGEGIDDVVGHRLRQGPDAGRARRARASAGERARCAPPTSCPRPSGWPSCCARCRPSSSTWRSWSTSTAAPPAWSRSRTSSRSWSARSSTSTTSRTPQVEPLPAATSGCNGSAAHRRGQRPARRRAARGRLGHGRRASCSASSADVPAEGESRRGRRLSACTVERGRRVAASARCASPSDRRLGAGRRLTRTRDCRSGLRHPRRPAERREVDAAQPHPRHEGDDRLRQAADHPHPGPRRAQPARRAGRVRRHARHPQAAHALGERLNDTATDAHRRRRRRVPRGRRHRAARARATSASRRACRATRSSSSTRSTSRRPTRCSSQLRSGRRARAERVLPGVGARPATASTRSSTHLVARLPEGPQYYPDDMVTDVPEAFWVAELVREQLLAVAREELPHSIADAGHRVGVARGSAARSSSSASRRRGS